MNTIQNIKNNGNAVKAANKNELVYMIGDTKITLTPQTVRNYLVSGDKDRVTDQEIVVFMNLCRFAKLNPWLKEAYCIKYGNEPATMVTGKEAFTKRAEENPLYDGYDAGIVVKTPDGEIVYRKGAMRTREEEVIGGYAEVFRKDRNHPYRIEVSFDEYAGRKKDGTITKQWSDRPATMIRKVALVQALREAFPKMLGGMFVAEEQGLDEEIKVDIPSEVVEQNVVESTAEVVGEQEGLNTPTKVEVNDDEK